MDWRTLRSINFLANYISFTSTLTSTHIDYDTLLFFSSPLVYFYSTDIISALIYFVHTAHVSSRC